MNIYQKKLLKEVKEFIRDNFINQEIKSRKIYDVTKLFTDFCDELLKNFDPSTGRIDFTVNTRYYNDDSYTGCNNVSVIISLNDFQIKIDMIDRWSFRCTEFKYTELNSSEHIYKYDSRFEEGRQDFMEFINS